MPDAWYNQKTVKTGYEISFNRYFYKPKPMRTLEEIPRGDSGRGAGGGGAAGGGATLRAVGRATMAEGVQRSWPTR